MNVTNTGKIPEILVIGVGKAGNKIIDRFWTASSTILTVAADTDEQVLDSTHADLKILLSKSQSKKPEEENQAGFSTAVTEKWSDIDCLIGSETIVFILEGYGRSAGSGESYEVAKIAREKGALVIALVSLPCLIKDGGIHPLEDYLHHLIDSADSVIVLQNNWILENFCHTFPTEVYAKMDGIILGVLEGLVTSLTLTCLEKCDREDFRAIFGNRGLAIVLYGESDLNVVNTNESVVRNCLKSPSLNIDYQGARGCFVLIAGGNDLNRFDTEEIATSLTYDLDRHAEIVWSSRIEKEMEGRVRVYAIITGIGEMKK